MNCKEYPKIQSIFKRDEITHKFILGDYSIPEFEYLSCNNWIGTEKIDGTNIRIYFDGLDFEIFGRTDNAQIPKCLIEKINDIISIDKLQRTFTNANKIVLYGEGYGNKIQSVGNRYIPNGVDFILFDILIDDKWWLNRSDISDVALNLGIKSVPIVFTGTLDKAIKMVSDSFKSELGDLNAEGLVLEPVQQLFTRKGCVEHSKLQTKIKTKDF